MIDNLKAERVKVAVSGSGSIKLAGTEKAEDLDVFISGSGNYTGINFEAEDAHVKLSGSGSANVFVHNSLTVRSSGSGDVIYRGNPAVHHSAIGSGQVVEYK